MNISSFNKYLCFFFSFYLISCSNQQVHKDLSMDGDYYTIDIDGKREEYLPMSSYFKSLQTVILETNDDCLIGLINELQVFDGTYVHTITIDAARSTATFIQYYDGRLYSSQHWWEKSEDNCMLLEIDPNDGKILSKSLSMKYNKNWNVPNTSNSKFFMSRMNNPPRYNRMFMDYIVNIGKVITPYIKLKSRFLTIEKDLENYDERPFDIQKLYSISKVFNVHCFVENKDFILFRCDRPPSSFVVGFDKKTEEVRLANHFNNDLIYKHNNQRWLGLFIFSDTKGVYEVLNTQSSFLNTFQNSIKNNEIVPDLDKLEQLKQLNADSNPVIFFYEFK